MVTAGRQASGAAAPNGVGGGTAPGRSASKTKFNTGGAHGEICICGAGFGNESSTGM